jgi:chaperonin GroES
MALNVKPLGDRILVEAVEEKETKKGDRILCSKYGGTEIKIDGKEYKILSSDDILAVLE